MSAIEHDDTAVSVGDRNGSALRVAGDAGGSPGGPSAEGTWLLGHESVHWNAKDAELDRAAISTQMAKDVDGRISAGTAWGTQGIE